MTRRLPVLSEASIADAKAVRLQLAQAYDLQLSSRTPERTCRAKCHNCCTHPVYASVLEGLLAYRALHDRWAQVKPSIEAMARRTWGLAPQIWAMADLSCPLLVDGLCSIYEARPFSCRVTYSVGDSENCRASRLGPDFLPKADILELFSKEERGLLARHNTQYLRVPLASALLWGARLDQGEVPLEEAHSCLQPPEVYV